MDVFHTPGADLLIQAVLSLKTEEECRAFLEDLMTGKEIPLLHLWRGRVSDGAGTGGGEQ